MDNNLERYKNIIIPIIVRHAPNAKIILYGSRARGNARQGSDIDIALDMGEKINKSLISKIMEDLENSRLPICFDVVDFTKISQDMQKEIQKDGIIWK